MSKKGKPASEDSITKDILAWRKDILKLAVMAIPSLLVTLGTAWLKEKLFAQPWQAIWVLLPLSLFVGAIWARIKKGGSLLFSKPFRWLLFGYVTIFSVAASSRFLDFQIRPVGYNHAVPRNWLSLNWAGDWRYWIARRKSVDPKLLVVTMARPEGRTLEDIRLDCIRLLKLATLQEAKGFAMDFYFDKGSQLDSLFCLTVAQARARKIEISLGYNIVAIENDFQRTFIAASLQNCFPLEAQGHLIGLAERDGKVRVMPLFFKGDRTLPSLSYKFASSILAKAGQTLLPPRSGLVQFVAPQEEIARVSYEKLIDDRERWPLLRDRFVLVGELSERDAFSTAFGKLPGVVIHAYAAHSLMRNNFINHAPWGYNFLLIFTFCFLLTALASQGASLGQLLKTNLLITIATFLLSAATMYFWLTWFDVIYALAAVWLFLPLVVVVKKGNRT